MAAPLDTRGKRALDPRARARPLAPPGFGLGLEGGVESDCPTSSGQCYTSRMIKRLKAAISLGPDVRRSRLVFLDAGRAPRRHALVLRRQNDTVL